jgi:hypothetical protein
MTNIMIKNQAQLLAMHDGLRDQYEDYKSFLGVKARIYLSHRQFSTKHTPRILKKLEEEAESKKKSLQDTALELWENGIESWTVDKILKL